MKAPRVSKILIVLAATAALAGCNNQRKGTSFAQKETDPRVAKTFDAAAPWFCSVDEIEYSESNDAAAGKSEKPAGDGIAKTRVIATGATKAAMLKALDAACAALGSAAAKTVCASKVKAEDYRCVGASTFDREPAKTGLWTCKMSYPTGPLPSRAGDRTLETSGKDTTSAEAIQSAFDQCAALKDADREACADALMNERLVCLDANQVKAHSVRHVYK